MSAPLPHAQRGARVGGLNESIVDGVTGSGDDAGTLARGWAQLVRDPRAARAAGHRAEARARSFTWERTAQEALTVLEEVRSARGHGSRGR
jgi:glycosyltransferase involved in cell wall biosynthesis